MTTLQQPWQENASELDNAFENHSSEEIDGKSDFIRETVYDSFELSEMHKRANAKKENKKKHQSLLSKRDARVLMYLHQVIQSQKEDEEALKQGKTIVKVDPNRFAPKANSLSYILYTILLASGKDGIHINDIIAKVEQSGYTLKSQYHKYPHIYSALLRQNHTVQRCGAGKFRLRNGFLPATNASLAASKQEFPKADTKIPTLIDVAKYVIEQCQDDVENLTMRTVWVIMQNMGYACNFDYLRAHLRASGLVKGKTISFKPLRNASRVAMMVK